MNTDESWSEAIGALFVFVLLCAVLGGLVFIIGAVRP